MQLRLCITPTVVDIIDREGKFGVSRGFLYLENLLYFLNEVHPLCTDSIYSLYYCCTMWALLYCTMWVLLCFLIFFCTLDAGLLARSQYSEGPTTGHLDTGFSWFPCVYKQMLRRFPTFQVATTCFSCSPPDLNLFVTNFTFCLHVK